MSSISAGTTSTTTLVHSGDTTGSLVFKTNDTGSGGTTAVTIDTSQRVGIGVTSPAKPLSVYGGDGYIQMLNASTGTANGDGAFIGVEGGTTALRIVNQENDAMSFHTNGLANERMRIDSSGNTSIGGTDAGATWTTSRLFVNGGYTQLKHSDGPLLLWNTTNTGTRTLVIFDATVGSTRTDVGSITYNGTATLYNSTSDQRLKQNIVDAGTALNTICEIKIRSFDWIQSQTHETHGVIAQELKDVVPQCVTEGTNNEDGSMNRPWQVDTSPLIPMLIKAIQELKAINDQQAETINALTARVVALEGK